MGVANPVLLAFNRGRISTKALARTDFKRTALSAEEQTNWMPRTLGSMMLRPGLEYTGATRDNQKAIQIPFIKAIDDLARVELTNVIMRVWVDDELVTRPSVTAAVANGSFTSDVASWTDVDSGSAVSSWKTGGYLSLLGTGNADARRRQQVTVTETNTVHALDITIERGPVFLRVGSTAGGDEYISETSLGTGYHSLAFTPTGDFYIDLFNYEDVEKLVASINVASSGVMTLTSPWSVDDLYDIRWTQSGDIIFCACIGYKQHKIERRGTESWSIVEYESDDGPFMLDNVGPVTITPSATSGDITLTASAALFTSGNVDSLFRLTHTGQSATAALSGADQYTTDYIRVVGTSGARAFSVIITGTWVGTLTLQYSVSEPGDWIDATSGSYTTNQSISFNDTLDNQVIYYRIGFKSADYTSGTADVILSYSAGSQTGIARVTAYTNATTVSAAVLTSFGQAAATSEWAESYWSDRRGYPSAVALYESRMWWAGKDRIWGSVTDSYYSFDDDTTGDSGPINRSIGSGPVEKIYWMIPVQRLLLGAGGAVWAARSSSFDEPLTPTNFNLKKISTQGAGAILSVEKDTSAIYVQRAGTRIYEASYDSNSYDYTANELSVHVPEVGEPAIIRSVIQHQPEVRIHHIRSDGTVAIQVYDTAEEVNCFVDFETDGLVQDVCVLPGDVEDQVYYTVARTIGGSTVRYHEKWALESECVGGTLNKQADSFLSASGSGSSITGLSHLEGESVVCWADGEDKGTFTVSSGAISQSYTTGYVVGLTYTARFKSVKLAYGAVDGASALTQKKMITALGVIAENMHYQGLQYGPDFDNLDELPLVEAGAETSADSVWSTYDYQPFSFDGRWDADSRLCLEATAPKPVTLLACTFHMETHSR